MCQAKAFNKLQLFTKKQRGVYATQSQLPRVTMDQAARSLSLPLLNPMQAAWKVNVTPAIALIHFIFLLFLAASSIN